MQKVILFILSLLSLGGFGMGIISGDTWNGWDWSEFMLAWFIFSIPLIIFFLAKSIFKF